MEYKLQLGSVAAGIVVVMVASPVHKTCLWAKQVWLNRNRDNRNQDLIYEALAQ